MKFEKVLLRRAYDSQVENGELIAHPINDKILETIKGERAKKALDKLLLDKEHVRTRSRRRALVVGVIADDEIYELEAIQDYLQSYGIMQIEHKNNKRIVIKIKDGELVIENLEEVFKNKRIYDFIDMFTQDTKIKYVKSKESFLCIDSNGNRSIEHLILKAEVRCQVIKDEYIDVFGTTPDQDE